VSERTSSLQGRLTRLLWLWIGAALVTICLKTAAWLLTDSVGLLSDAAESIVNLVAASVALATLYWASQPPDTHHPYGHEKAEYFSARLEGGMILLAAVSIAWFALERLLHPAALQDVALGLAVSAVASAGQPLGRRPTRACWPAASEHRA
jgi:cation diffusion facilitator family transporter